MDGDVRVLDVPKLPWGIRAVEKLLQSKCANTARIKTSYQVFIFFLTYAIYAFYTLSRRPFSVVKIVLCPPCTNETLLNSLLEDRDGIENESDVSIAGWPPFNSVTQGKTLLGSVDYSLIFAYATGLYISGYIADRVNLRYFVTVGIAGSGIAALLQGFAFFFRVHHLAYFIVFQILAGFMQSTGWPGLLGVTAKWFGRKNRGKILAFWGSCSFVGSILGYIIPSSFVQSENVENSPWGWAFVLPAIIMFVMAALCFFFLVTDPVHLGLPDAVQTIDEKTAEQKGDEQGGQEEEEKWEGQEKRKGDETQAEKGFEGGGENGDEKDGPAVEAEPLKAKTKGIGYLQALLIPGVIEYSLSFFCSKFVAYSFNFWLPFYVAVSYPELGGRNAAWLTTLFDIGGIMGGLFIGAVSDKIHSRSVLIVPMLVLGVPWLLLMRLYGHVALGFYAVAILGVGILVNGPHIIVTGAVANDLGTHKSLKDSQHAKSIVAGIIDGTGSMGAALGPLLVGVVTDKSSTPTKGWDNVFYMMMASTFLSALLILRLLITDLKKLHSNCRSWSWRSYKINSTPSPRNAPVVNKKDPNLATSALQNGGTVMQLQATNRMFDLEGAEGEEAEDLRDTEGGQKTRRVVNRQECKY